MVSNKIILDTLDVFGYLKYSPKTEKQIAGYIALITQVMNTDEDFKKAFDLWIEQNDTFPSHIELKKMLEPKILELSKSDIFDSEDRTQEKDSIRNWCQERFDCEMPPEGSHERQTMTSALFHKILSNQHWAVDQYYKKVKEKKADHFRIINDEQFKLN